MNIHKVILEIKDNGRKYYSVSPSTDLLARQWDNMSVNLIFKRPRTELDSVCHLMVLDEREEIILNKIIPFKEVPAEYLSGAMNDETIPEEDYVDDPIQLPFEEKFRLCDYLYASVKDIVTTWITQHEYVYFCFYFERADKDYFKNTDMVKMQMMKASKPREFNQPKPTPSSSQLAKLLEEAVTHVNLNDADKYDVKYEYLNTYDRIRFEIPVPNSVNYTKQNLTDDDKQIARDNIDVPSRAEAIQSWALNNENGVITIKWADGTVSDIFTNIHKTIKSYEFDDENGVFLFTTFDDEVEKLDISPFVDSKLSELSKNVVHKNSDTRQEINSDIKITGNFEIIGDILQRGTTYKAHVEELYAKNSIIKTRDGATFGLGDNEYTGIQAIKYDGENDGLLVFDNKGIAYVGDAAQNEDGSLSIKNAQPIATREDTPLRDGYAKWNADKLRFDTSYLKQSDLTDYSSILNWVGLYDEEHVYSINNVVFYAEKDGRYQGYVCKKNEVKGIAPTPAELETDEWIHLNYFAQKLVVDPTNEGRLFLTGINDNSGNIRVSGELTDDAGNVVKAPYIDLTDNTLHDGRGQLASMAFIEELTAILDENMKDAFDEDVIKDIAVEHVDNTNDVNLNLRLVNLWTARSLSRYKNKTVPINLASEEHAGLLSKEDYKALRGLDDLITGQLGKINRFNYTKNADPTSDELSEYMNERGQQPPYTEVEIKVAETDKVYVYNSELSKWVSVGYDTPAAFNSSKEGLIRGAELDGYITAHPDATGSVFGWDTLKSRVKSIEDSYVDKSSDQEITGTKTFSSIHFKNNAIQIGEGTNNTPNTMKVFDLTLINAEGKVPAEVLDIDAVLDEKVSKLTPIVYGDVQIEGTNEILEDNGSGEIVISSHYGKKYEWDVADPVKSRSTVLQVSPMRFNAQITGPTGDSLTSLLLNSSGLVFNGTHAYLYSNVDIDGTLNIRGNIIQSGEAYEMHAEKLYTANDYIFLREHAHDSSGNKIDPPAMGVNDFVGLIAKNYDGETDGALIYDKFGYARIGDVRWNEDGSIDASKTRKIVVRKDEMENGKVVVWNEEENRIETSDMVSIRTIASSDIRSMFNRNSADIEGGEVPPGSSVDWEEIRLYVEESINTVQKENLLRFSSVDEILFEVKSRLTELEMAQPSQDELKCTITLMDDELELEAEGYYNVFLMPKTHPYRVSSLENILPIGYDADNKDASLEIESKGMMTLMRLRDADNNYWYGHFDYANSIVVLDKVASERYVSSVISPVEQSISDISEELSSIKESVGNVDISSIKFNFGGTQMTLEEIITWLNNALIAGTQSITTKDIMSKGMVESNRGFNLIEL